MDVFNGMSTECQRNVNPFESCFAETNYVRNLLRKCAIYYYMYIQILKCLYRGLDKHLYLDLNSMTSIIITSLTVLHPRSLKTNLPTSQMIKLCRH